MAKRHSSKRKKRPLAGVPARSAKTQAALNPSFFRRTLTWITSNLLVVGAGAVASAIGIYQFVLPEFSEPEIHEIIAYGDNPFALHFSTKNPSRIFRMRDVTFGCQLIFAKYENGSMLTDDFFVGHSLLTEIEPGETVEYRCPVDDFLVLHTRPVSAELKVVGRYRSGAYPVEHTFESPLFSWNTDSKRWVEGRRVN